MIPVDQQIVADGHGDCLRACICSLLELNPDDVPNFAECGFFDGLDRWLKPRGLRFLRFSIPHTEEFTDKQVWFDYPLPEDDPDFTPMYMLSWGRSPRFDAEGNPRQHIVVVQPNGYGIKLVHDPHLSRLGLTQYWGFGWIVSAQTNFSVIV